MVTPIPTTTLDIILDTPKPKAKSTSLSKILGILGIVTFFSVILLTTFLALDILTIPYLTPLAHFIALIISPFVPLLFPLFVGVFLKVCQHKPWPNKKTWVFLTGAWVIQHAQRALTDLVALYREGEICGLEECRGKWVEWVLVCVVVGAQISGWKWDAGYVERWVERIVEEDRKKAVAIEEEARKKGEESAGMDLEKGVASEVVGYESTEEEKGALMEREEVAKKGVLNVVDQEKA